VRTIAEIRRVEPVGRPVKYIFVDADGNRSGEVGQREGEFYFEGDAGKALQAFLRGLK